MNAYTTPKGFMDLFYDFTGYTHQGYPKEQRAVAQDLSETLARNAVDDESGPLVVADSKGIYVYDSEPGHKLIVQSEYRAALNSGFYEVTSVSHVGPAIAYLGVLHKYGSDAWKAHIKPMMQHLDDVRNVNQKPLPEHWLTQLNCAAWKGHEHRIQKLIDYACGLAGNYLAMVDKDMSAFSSKHVLDNFLEVQNDTFPVPYNTVMIGTFSLAGLKSAYDIYCALSSVNINWQSAKVLLHNLAGTNFGAGLTAGSNWLHPLIQSIAGEKLANDRIFIVPYAPAFDGLGAPAMSEEQYNRLANTVWGSIYSRPVVMNEAFANVPSIEVPMRQPIPGDYGYTKAHQIDHFLQRLKFSTGNIKEMLSNTVGFWLAGEAKAKNWVLDDMAIPGLTDGLPEGLNEYPDNLPAFQGLYL